LLQGYQSEMKVVLIDFGLAELVDDKKAEEAFSVEQEEVFKTGDGSERKKRRERVSNGERRPVASGTYPYIDPIFSQTGVPFTKCDMWSVGVMVARSMMKSRYFAYSCPS